MELVQSGFEGAGRFVRNLLSCSFNLTVAAIDRFVEVGQALGQCLARGPDCLGFLGLNRPELFDRLLERSERGVGLFREPPVALGQKLQLMSQGCEFFDEIDDPEFAKPAATIWISQAPSWARIDDKLPKVDRQPPPAA